MDSLALAGGSIGVVYLLGYLVLASHQRALGLPMRTSEASALIANAWEFGFRGTLLILITVAGGTARWFDPWWVPTSLLALAILVAIALRWVRWRPAVPMRLRAHMATSWPFILALTVLSAGGLQFASNTVPLTGVQDLLFSQGETSPFEALPKRAATYLTGHWRRLHSSLKGDAPPSADAPSYGDPQRRTRLFVIHVLLALGSFAAYLEMKRWRAGGRLARRLRQGVLATALLHASFAPIYYGVLIKSYSYPQVRITAKPTGDAAVDAMYKDLPLRFHFLIEATENDLYLYVEDAKQIRIMRRDSLASLQIVGTDVVLRQH